MKKLFLLFAFGAIFTPANAQQNLSVGGQIGIPVSNISPNRSLNIGVNLAYTTPIAENLRLGIATGFSRYTKDDKPIIPIAAKAKYSFTKSPLFVDLDLGYALNIRDSYSGFYTYPKIGYSIKKHDLFLGYQFVTGKQDVEVLNMPNVVTRKQNFNHGAINIGYNYNFSF
ncbi:MAG: hypothetical protein Q4G16_10505 [Cruoricaptor ignavus]|nr:hypothetical protein [Cruoricaptor ignavus]